MKEKLIKFAWYFSIWFMFMLFTAVVAKPLADNNFPLPTSSIFINTSICFLIPYIIYRKFMDYKARHGIEIENIVVGLGIYFLSIFVLIFVLHSNDKPSATENKIDTEKIETVAEEEKLVTEQKAREEQERLAAEQKEREEQERLAAEQKEREEQEKLAAEQKEREEQERLAAEQKAREEQERLAATQNSEPSFLDKAKEKIASTIEDEIKKLRKEASEFTQDEIYVGSLAIIKGAGDNQDWYVLTKSVKRFKEGIIFETYQGFQVDVVIKKGGTDEIISPLPITIKFYNNDNILESEDNVKYMFKGGMSGGSKDYLVPRKNDVISTSSGFYNELISIIQEVYSVSKKFSLLN